MTSRVDTEDRTFPGPRQGLRDAKRKSRTDRVSVGRWNQGPGLGHVDVTMEPPNSRPRHVDEGGVESFTPRPKPFGRSTQVTGDHQTTDKYFPGLSVKEGTISKSHYYTSLKRKRSEESK